MYFGIYDNGWQPIPIFDEAAVKSLSANELGLYDLSGNVYEWCFTESGSNRVKRGGGFGDVAEKLQVGGWSPDNPSAGFSYLGFRLCRTAD